MMKGLKQLPIIPMFALLYEESKHLKNPDGRDTSFKGEKKETEFHFLHL